MTPALAVEAPRPFPHVGGRSTRVKAEPRKLTALAARVMCASGSFATKRSPARPFSARFAAVCAVLLAGAALVVAGDPRPVLPNDPIAEAQFALSSAVVARELSEVTPAAGPAQAPLDAQDRFEIERLFRLSEAASRPPSPERGW